MKGNLETGACTAEFNFICTISKMILGSGIHTELIDYIGKHFRRVR